MPEYTAAEREDAFLLPTYQNIRLPLTIVRGAGNYVYDESGAAYLDLYGGHAVCSLGHAHPRWVREMQAQLETLTFYSNAVYNPARGEAAELLVRCSYPSMRRVFFCNSGAEANETALKIARKGTGRGVVVAMRGGFHGRTVGALSVTGFPAMRARFPQNIDGWTRFYDFGDPALFELPDPEAVAAVLLEPVQSVGGVHVAAPEYYRELRRYCDRHGIFLIFDEVQTAPGRTGHWCAGTHWDVEPDVVTTAKGVGGGVPAGVVIVNEKAAATVEPGDQATTFGGNPLAAAGIRATYRIIAEEGLLERVRAQSEQLRRRLTAVKGVRAVRGLGYLLGVECDRPAAAVQQRLFEERILAGTCSQPDTLRLLPPLTVDGGDWDRFLDAFERVWA